MWLAARKALVFMLAGVGKKHSPGRLIENGPMDQDIDPAQSQGGKTNLRREIRMKGQIPLILG